VVARKQRSIPFRVAERGEVYFLLQPRVETPFPEGLHDVQRVFMLQRPWGATHFRRILLARKRLPRGGGRRERFWSFVDRVGPLERVLEGLEPYTYDTLTRGVRFQPGARLVCSGSYAIAHHGDHTHLSYALAPGTRCGEIHDVLGIRHRASYVLLAMRPWMGQRGARQWYSFPEELRAVFGEKRFVEPRLPMLDLEGMNIVLVGTGDPGAAIPGDDPSTTRPNDPESLQLRRELVSAVEGWRPIAESPRSGARLRGDDAALARPCV
jgi:hypothetical protein